MNWYLQGLKKYAVFDGRATRQEYWMYVLFNSLAMIAFAIVDAVMGTSAKGMMFGLFSAVYLVGTLLPSLAVLVRRLHDTNRSGWWVLLSLVPLGGLVLLVFAVMDSDAGPNQYGPNPKIAFPAMAMPGYPAQPAQAMAQAAGNPMGQAQPYYGQPAYSPTPAPMPAQQYQPPAAGPSIGFAPAQPQPAATPAPSPYAPPAPQAMPQAAPTPQPPAPQAAAAHASHNFCANCGAQLAAGAHFCPNCGVVA